eukprot:358859-Chlamydomonas_euryale.AAC.5
MPPAARAPLPSALRSVRPCRALFRRDVPPPVPRLFHMLVCACGLLIQLMPKGLLKHFRFCRFCAQTLPKGQGVCSQPMQSFLRMNQDAEKSRRVLSAPERVMAVS